ncbi:MAG: transpeptidase family protein [Deltaproteobacteria bacterium]|nr:transpeptidase family protein [Deltaproteobacteria bacterium]
MRKAPLRTVPRFFSERRLKRRIVLIALCYFLLFSVVVGRTLELHIADNTKLSKLAQTQYQKKITLAPKRGNIYDVHGEELAIDVKVDSLYANPRQLKDPDGVADKLAPLLSMEVSKLKELLEKDKKFVWIKRRLSPEESEKIQALKIENIGLVKEFKRFYPNKTLAANLLGAVGLDSVALGGLELYYDQYLKSTLQPIVVNQDARGRSYSPYDLSEKDNPNNVKLTLDKTIQFIVEKELALSIQKTQAKSAIALVMNTKTGEVLGMATAPDFNPNEYSSYDQSAWKNRVVTDSFEPGSIFKAITAGAALESGRVTLGQKFNCEGGAMKVGKFTINDHGNYGAMALPDIIRVSSNIGSYKIAQYLGRDYFSKIVQDFGFGTKTGIDLPGEVSGIMASPKNWDSLKMGTIAFGQGIAVTPIQVVAAYSAIANGGYLMKPYIVKEIYDSKGNLIRENKPQIVRQVLSESHARKLVDLLKLVVETGGTGTAAQVPEYGVAGKTGTAQKVSEGHAGYADGKYIASFVGVAPADDPSIAVLVSINEPKGEHFGGVVAAPVFREIVRKTLPYLRVPPRGNHGPVVITKEDVKEDGASDSKNKNVKDPKNVKEAKEKSKSEALAKKESIKNKSKTESENHPIEATEELPQEISKVDSESYRLPDYRGQSMRQVMRSFKGNNLKLLVDGSGLCHEQEPAPGKIVKKGSEIKLSFKPPS